MKKLITTLLLIIVTIYFYRKSYQAEKSVTSNHSTKRVNTTIKKPQRRENQTKAQRLTSTSLQKSVKKNDRSSKSADKFYNTKEERIKDLKAMIKKNRICLLNHSCKKRKRDANHPYNDINNTYAHQQLINALSDYSRINNRGIASQNNISSGDLIEILQINNSDIMAEAFKILLNKNDPRIFNKTFRYAKNFTGSDASFFLKIISRKLILNEDDNREKRNKVIENYILSSDLFTLSKVSKELIKIELSKQEVTGVLKSYCKRPIDRGTDAGKMIHLSYQKLAAQHSRNLACK